MLLLIAGILFVGAGLYMLAAEGEKVGIVFLGGGATMAFVSTRINKSQSAADHKGTL
ncbi:hypothetical protein [Erythrobacter ani]|uniref:Uncharacterized protein n=1 Tax=Erythrobacter ani TaxID=2827235 RepID=A0ABS6SPK9_9SPHN|nr:hypothetical protein [Erythrobacter ani]MBV7266974.1 hypothetical protein [Erythrobacter ani]